MQPTLKVYNWKFKKVAFSVYFIVVDNAQCN